MKTNIFFFFLIILVTISCTNKRKKQPIADKGTLDLKSWNFQKDGNVSINGEWEFYYKQILTNTELENGQGNLSGYVKTPGTWKKLIINGNPIKGTGYATLRLRINTKPKNK